MVITPASQAGKGGSIPLTRSNQSIIDSPIGKLGLVVADDALLSIRFIGSRRSASKAFADPFAQEVAKQLASYFKDPNWRFSLKLRIAGTPFQRKVWKAIEKIPVGETRRYGEIAERLQSGPRAVARACASNVLPVIIPCHRVVGVAGLCGYGHSGNARMLDKKQWLLDHET